MPASSDTKPNIDELVAFLRNQNFGSISDFRSALREPAFRADLYNVLRSVAKRNGATLTLATVTLWLSIAIGSIGIAGLGSAIGVPVAAVLVPAWALLGGYLDEDGFFARTRNKVFDLIGRNNTSKEEAFKAAIADSLDVLSQRIDEIAERTDLLEQLASELSTRANQGVDGMTLQKRWISIIAIIVSINTAGLIVLFWLSIRHR